MKDFLKKCGTAVKSGAKNMLYGTKERWYYWFVILGAILIDQFTKWLAVKYLKPVGSVPLWQGVLHLTYLQNKGAAFGMLSDRRAVFMVISILGLTVFLIYLFAKKERETLLDIGLAMVIGGGIGNMIDRVALGYVVDFIDFALIDFAIFNGADSFVCVGAGMMILAMILSIIHESKAQKAAQNEGLSHEDDADGR